jgi:hypothetical protein
MKSVYFEKAFICFNFVVQKQNAIFSCTTRGHSMHTLLKINNFNENPTKSIKHFIVYCVLNVRTQSKPIIHG